MVGAMHAAMVSQDWEDLADTLLRVLSARGLLSSRVSSTSVSLNASFEHTDRDVRPEVSMAPRQAACTYVYVYVCVCCVCICVGRSGGLGEK